MMSLRRLTGPARELPVPGRDRLTDRRRWPDLCDEGHRNFGMDSIVKMGVRQNRDGRPEEDSAAAAKAASRLSDERPCTGQAGSRRAGEFPPAGGRDEMKGTEAADTGRPDRKETGEDLTEQEGAAAQEKQQQRELRRICRTVARYAVVALVVSYICTRIADHMGGILQAAARAAGMAGMLLQPLFWGFVLAYVLLPLEKMCERRLRGIPPFNKKGARRRGPAVAITMAGVLLALLALLSVVVSAVTRSLKIASLEDLVDMVRSFAQTFQNFAQTIMDSLAEYSISSEEVSAAVREIGQRLAGFTGGLGSGLAGRVTQIGGFLTGALFAVIFAVYFLMDRENLGRYWSRVLLAVGGKKARRTFRVLTKDADAVFSGYIRGQLIDALIMAVLVSASLSLIGVHYAVIIGILSGIGNLIPYVGPVVAYGSTILVCLVSGDLRRLLAALIILFIIQTLDGNVINPRLLSNTVDIHPMLVIAALIIGGSVGGVVGMLFAVPVAAFLRIQFDRIIDRLLLVRVPEKAARRKKRPGSIGKQNRAGEEKDAATGSRTREEAADDTRASGFNQPEPASVKKAAAKKRTSSGDSAKKNAGEKTSVQAAGKKNAGEKTSTRAAEKKAVAARSKRNNPAAKKKTAGNKKTAGTGRKAPENQKK